MNQSFSTGWEWLDNYKYKNILFFIITFYASIHNEFTSLYGIGAIVGIIILSIFKEKQLRPTFKIPSYLYSIYFGLAIGGGITIFAPALSRRAMLGQSYIDTLNVIYSDLNYALVPLVLVIIVVILSTMILSRNNSILQEKIKSQFWISIYCMCCFFGWGLIVTLAKVPYLRVQIIGQGILPLLYLLIIWGWLLLEQLPKIVNKYIIPCFCGIIILISFTNTGHNIKVMTAIQWQLKENILKANENKTKLIVYPYIASFKISTIKKEGCINKLLKWDTHLKGCLIGVQEI